MLRKEEVDALRRKYPPGSGVVLHEMKDDPNPVPPGSKGTLELIDDAGGFHVKWENGRSLSAIYGVDAFDVTPPELTALKLYMPIGAELFEPDDDGNMPEEGGELSGAALADYRDAVAEALEAERAPEEAERGIMRWYDGDDAVSAKVESAVFRAESRDGKLWCVAECQVRGMLAPAELDALKEHIRSQAVGGFGEGLESRSVSLGDGAELCVHLWQPDGWFIRTEKELFGDAPAKEPLFHPPKKRPEMELLGHDGNIFSILGRASRLLKAAGMRDEAKEMCNRVTNGAHSYDEALQIVSEYVRTEISDALPQKKPRKRGKKSPER